MIAISLYGFLLWLTLRNMKNKTAKTGLCAVFVSLMVLIPVSRIYLGVHFVGDVLGGMIIAGAYILFYIEIYKKRIGMKKPADVEK